MIYLHKLTGCAPTPLAHYLKALGILRLVACQADPTARGYWRDDVFYLATSLSEEELKTFFLEKYAPTPLIAPWNGGSGFWEKDNKDGFKVLAGTEAPRFAAYRKAILCAKELFSDLSESPKNEEKARRLALLRGTLSSEALEWLDAALMIANSSLRYPAILGTGGNDGRLDFTNNFMRRLVLDLFDGEGRPRDFAPFTLNAALFADIIRPGSDSDCTGQFLPGPPDSSKSTMNPWDFVLMLEGAIALQISAVRRLDGADLPQAAAPFAVEGRSSGYASASPADGSNGRGEQWMPLWNEPATFDEVRQLFAEGRLKTGGKSARQPVEAAIAIRRLGAARGITSFQRFGYIERNGQANLAVPLGRFASENKPQLKPLQEVLDWVERLVRKIKADDERSPGSIQRLPRVLNDECLAVCQDPDSPERWQALLIRLGEAEDAIALRPELKSKLKPLPKLSSNWLERANDKSPEWRLACAFASQFGATSRDEESSVRAHCLPLDRFGNFDNTADVRVVWQPSASLSDNLIAVVQRRLMESQSAGKPQLALRSNFAAPESDIECFIGENVDDKRIAALTRGLMSVRFPQQNNRKVEGSKQGSSSEWRLSPLHALFRLCVLRYENADAAIPANEMVYRRLASGQLEAAGRAAFKHLSAHGYRAKLTRVFGSSSFARRIAAALAFPLDAKRYDALLNVVLKPEDEAEDASDSSRVTSSNN